MCVPGVLQVSQIAANIGKSVIDYNQQSKANEYRSQVAINNIKSAQDEAKRQIQLGIEKSREEKILGIKKANALLAKSASSNTDAVSDSNLQNYYDIQDMSNLNAQNIQNEYNLKADAYFDKANSYLNSYRTSQKTYRNSVLKNAVNSLGGYSKVASSWYSTGNGGFNNYGTI